MNNERSCTLNDIDILNRDNFIQTLYELIDSYKKNGQVGGFAVYGNWGVGKTFVLKKLEERLRPDTYMVLSYSAWEYDYYDEPLIALLAAIKDTLSKNGQYDEQAKVFKEELPSILYKLTKISILAIAAAKPPVAGIIDKSLGVLENLVKSCKKESKNQNFDNLSAFKSAIKQFQSVLKDISQTRKIIFLVDELDRCLPQYQIKVLEHMHHLSKDIDCICVYAVSDKQLRHTVSNIFGQNVDFDGYMKKFIDFHLMLDNAQVDDNVLERYSDEIQKFNPLSCIEDNKIIYNLIKTTLSGLNIRTQEKIWDKQKILHLITFPSNQQSDLRVLGCEIMFLAMLERYKRYNIDKKDVTDRVNQKISYHNFIRHYFPEKDGYPGLPLLDVNIINLFRSYTDEACNHIIHHDKMYYESTNAQFLPKDMILFDNNSLILTILYTWDKVTEANSNLWENIPAEVTAFCDKMKEFYTKAMILQDKN